MTPLIVASLVCCIAAGPRADLASQNEDQRLKARESVSTERVETEREEESDRYTRRFRVLLGSGVVVGLGGLSSLAIGVPLAKQDLSRAQATFDMCRSIGGECNEADTRLGKEKQTLTAVAALGALGLGGGLVMAFLAFKAKEKSVASKDLARRWSLYPTGSGVTFRVRF